MFPTRLDIACIFQQAKSLYPRAPRASNRPHTLTNSAAVPPPASNKRSPAADLERQLRNIHRDVILLDEQLAGNTEQVRSKLLRKREALFRQQIGIWRQITLFRYFREEEAREMWDDEQRKAAQPLPDAQNMAASNNKSECESEKTNGAESATQAAQKVGVRGCEDWRSLCQCRRSAQLRSYDDDAECLTEQDIVKLADFGEGLDSSIETFLWLEDDVEDELEFSAESDVLVGDDVVETECERDDVVHEGVDVDDMW